MRRIAVLYIKLIALATVLLLSFSGAYIAINHNRIFPNQDQIVIYGRDTCVLTSALRESLDAKSVPYIYANIAQPLTKLEFEAQLNLAEERTVTLPVVLVGGRTLESPNHEAVFLFWQEAGGRKP